jgi:hypothetical protein
MSSTNNVKKIIPVLSVFIIMIISILSCSNPMEAGYEMTSESSIEDAMQHEEADWGPTVHRMVAWYAAEKLGLDDRYPYNNSDYGSWADLIANNANAPDYYDEGINDGNIVQQLYHSLIFSPSGQLLIGFADRCVTDNIKGGWMNEFSRYGKSAAYYFNKHTMYNKRKGFEYIGYASHYLTDMNLMLHTTFPLDMYGVNLGNLESSHYDYESWIEDNWDKGHRFKDEAASVPRSQFYNPNTYGGDLARYTREAAMACNYHLNDNMEAMWKSYWRHGHPKRGMLPESTSAVIYTRWMIRESVKWTGGMIKYTLDHYKDWPHQFGPFGGNGGGYFYWTLPSNAYMTKVEMRGGSLVDGFTVFYRYNGSSYEYNRKFGGNGGGRKTIYLSTSNWLTGASVRSGSMVDQLTLKSKSGTSVTVGGSGGGYNNVNTYGKKIIGFFGRGGALIDQIGFITE